MFLRLVTDSFLRQRRRKALAGAAILLGTTAVTAMLALATSIGDRIHRELAVYGANIVVYPKADQLAVKIAGVDLKPATGGAYLKESDLDKLHGIFWANNITGISPELRSSGLLFPIDWAAEMKTEWGDTSDSSRFPNSTKTDLVGYWFNHSFGTINTGAPSLHPWWKLQGRWPSEDGGIVIANSLEEEVVIGSTIARKFNLHLGDSILLRVEHVGKIVGIVSSGDATDDSILYALDANATAARRKYGNAIANNWPQNISRVEISATTRPEDAFARQDPSKLSPKQHDIWYCRPYANSIAFQIMEAIPGAQAEQVRRVEQTEGTVLSRISGLMWLVSLAALLAAGFAVSAAMATAVLERRGEIGLMRSLGASRGTIALLFYAESSLLALVAGAFGYLCGSLLAFWLGRHIFAADGATPVLYAALLPIVVAMAIIVAILGSTPSIRTALRTDPATTLRGGA